MKRAATNGEESLITFALIVIGIEMLIVVATICLCVVGVVTGGPVMRRTIACGLVLLAFTVGG